MLSDLSDLPPLERSRKMEKSYVPWAGVEGDRLCFAQRQQTLYTTNTTAAAAATTTTPTTTATTTATATTATTATATAAATATKTPTTPATTTAIAHEGICLNLYTEMHHQRAVVLSDSGWILVKLVGGIRVAELRNNSIRILQNLCCTHVTHLFHPTLVFVWIPPKFAVAQPPQLPPVYCLLSAPCQGGTISVNVDFC